MGYNKILVIACFYGSIYKLIAKEVCIMNFQTTTKELKLKSNPSKKNYGKVPVKRIDCICPKDNKRHKKGDLAKITYDKYVYTSISEYNYIKHLIKKGTKLKLVYYIDGSDLWTFRIVNWDLEQGWAPSELDNLTYSLREDEFDWI